MLKVGLRADIARVMPSELPGWFEEEERERHTQSARKRDKRQKKKRDPPRESGLAAMNAARAREILGLRGGAIREGNSRGIHALNEGRPPGHGRIELRRYLRKLLVRKPELIPIHQRFLSEAVNHKTSLTPTTLWVWTLIPPSPEGVIIVSVYSCARARRSKSLAHQRLPEKSG